MANFWDSLFADEQAFQDEVERLLPGTALVGGRQYVWNTLAAAAYLNPYSPEGLFTRQLIALGTPQGASISQWQSAWAGSGDWVNDGGAGGTWDWGTAMTLVIANAYRVSIVMTSGTRQVVNVVGVRGTTSGQQAAAAAAVLAAWKVTTGPLKYLSSNVVMQYVEATDLSTVTGGISRVTDSTAGGAGAISLSTAAASALVKWNGDSRSRSTRGRTYFGPLDEGSIGLDGRTLSSTAVTAIGTAFTNFRSSLSTAGFPLVVLSRKTSAMHDVTLQQVEQTIATQRRRIRS